MTNTFSCKYCEELKKTCDYCSLTYDWEKNNCAPGSYYYDKNSGQIVGSTRLSDNPDCFWIAKIGDTTLGEFIYKEHAKTAVENKVILDNKIFASRAAHYHRGQQQADERMKRELAEIDSRRMSALQQPEKENCKWWNKK